MTPDTPQTPEPAPDPTASPVTPPPELPLSAMPRTPISWRLGIAAAIGGIAGAAYLLQPMIGTRGQAVAGVFCFFGIVALFSTNLRAVNWRTIGWGIALQILLVLLVLKAKYTVETQVGIDEKNGAPILVETEYSVQRGLERVAKVVRKFIDFSDEGARFVFGNLANPGDLALSPGKEFLFIFAFKALPPILFVSAFFTVLYHLGVLQWCVRLMARVMVYLMGTS